MAFIEKLDWNILQQYIDNNLIICNKHPNYDIWVLCYSPKVTYKNFWDDYTSTCRGLVIDKKGNILARPFLKFHRIENYDVNDINFSQEYDILEKLDGSLIIMFYYEPRMEWITLTKKSFITEQAQEAKKILNLKPNIYEVFDKKCTYCFEIIYPENKIVVDYGELRDLFLLSRIVTESGFELYYDDLADIYSKHIGVVKRYKFNNINNLYELKKFEENNKEGFVVRFLNGFRVKVKFNQYIKQHAFITNVSTITIWELLRNNYDIDCFFEQIPDETHVWCEKIINQLKNDFYFIERIALKEFVDIIYHKKIINRKDFANIALKSDYRKILFNIYNNFTYDKLIWNMIKPKNIKYFNNIVE